MSEDHETRLKRLHMRSIRRGIKEMDLILTAYAQDRLKLLSASELDTYEAFLAENDQDLFPWVTGQDTAPDRYAGLLADIRRIAVGLGHRAAGG